MKKFLFTAIVWGITFFVFSPIHASAESITSTADNRVQIGDVVTNAGQSAPWVQPGPAGNNNPLNPLQNAGQQEKGPKTYHTLYISNLDGLPFDRIGSMARTISVDRVKYIDEPVMVDTDEESGIYFWKPGEKISGIYLNTVVIVGKKNENRESISARAAFEMYKKTKGNYCHISTLVREKQDSTVNSYGAGLTRILSDIMSLAGGFLKSDSELEAGEYLIYLAKMYYVDPDKIREIKSAKPETAEIKTSAPAQTLAQPKPSTSEPQTAKKVTFRIVPVMMDYDKDMPYDDQTPTIWNSAKVFFHLFKSGIEVIVKGLCDTRGGETYNDGLGQRRADNVKALYEKSVLMQSPPELHAEIKEYFRTKVIAKSAGEREAEFGPEKHWQDRRVDIIVEGNNITLPNIGGAI